MNRLRPVLTLGGLALLALVIWVAVLAPLAHWKAQAFSNLQSLRADEARLITSLATLRKEHAVLTGSSDVSFIWQSAQIGTATAEVQSALSDIAGKSGISLRSITPLPESKSGSGSTIAFRVESEATLDTLTRFLGALEYNDRALVVRLATLRRLARPGSEGPQPTLFFQMEVVAPVIVASGGAL
ncbi:MAG: type II secretion system protein GspM [Deltaproteobacteria bacterium]